MGGEATPLPCLTREDEADIFIRNFTGSAASVGFADFSSFPPPLPTFSFLASSLAVPLGERGLPVALSGNSSPLLRSLSTFPLFLPLGWAGGLSGVSGTPMASSRPALLISLVVDSSLLLLVAGECGSRVSIFSAATLLVVWGECV